MHHYYVLADDLFFDSYTRLAESPMFEGKSSGAIYDYFLDNVTTEKSARIIGRIQEYLNSGKPFLFSHGPE